MWAGKEKATVQNRGKPWAGNSAGAGANNILLLAGTKRKKKEVWGNFVLIWRISQCLCPKQASFCRAGIFCFSSTISCYYCQAHPIIIMSLKIWIKTEDLESRAGYMGVAGVEGGVMEQKCWHCLWTWGMHHTGNSPAEAEELVCSFVLSCTPVLGN